MLEKDFVNQFLSSCPKEKLLQYKDQLLVNDVADKEIIDALFSKIEQEEKSFIDRNIFLRILIDYICTTGKTVPFIMDLFKDLLLQDGCTEEAIEYAVKSAYKTACNVREIKMQKEFYEKKRLKEERLKREEALKKLESSIDMSTTVVSYDTARFLIRNGFTYEEIKSKCSLRLVSQEDIDFVLYRYRIDCDCKQEMVSIADVVGYDYAWMGGENDLLKAFPNFFDSHPAADGYHKRSLSMLDLTTENAIEELSPSFKKEPLKLEDAPNKKYTINGNGMHRYSVLRGLYCIEMVNAKGNKEQEKAIYEKYKIPALVSKIDYVKTYANYILTTLKVAKWVSKEIDSNYCATGRAKIVLSDNETIFLTNEELLEYVGNILRSNENSVSVEYLIQNANTYFLKFLALTVPEMVEENNNHLEEENGKSM